MNKDELNQLTTVKDLENLAERIMNGVKGLLLERQTVGKEFLTPKEFCHLTGLKYNTVIYRCKVGKLKARQDDPNCGWQIDITEIDRFKREAQTNTL